MTILDGHPALGTKWWIQVFDQNIDIDSTKALLTSTIEQFENSYSRFKPDSLISQLNNDKKLSNPPTELISMLNICLELHNNSNGLFNPLVGSILENLGYDSEYSFQAKQKSSEIDISHLEILDSEIKLDDPSVRIDLGGIGKGFLIDKLANLLKENDSKYFIINGGGDIYATSNHNESFSIKIEHPLDSTKSVFETSIKNQALCSSSALKRKWGDNANHIINPHAKSSSQPIPLSSHIKHNSTTYADMLATISLMAEPRLIERLQSIYQFEFLLVLQDQLLRSPGF